MYKKGDNSLCYNSRRLRCLEQFRVIKVSVLIDFYMTEQPAKTVFWFPHIIARGKNKPYESQTTLPNCVTPNGHKDQQKKEKWIFSHLQYIKTYFQHKHNASIQSQKKTTQRNQKRKSLTFVIRTTQNIEEPLKKNNIEIRCIVHKRINDILSWANEVQIGKPQSLRNIWPSLW